MFRSFRNNASIVRPNPEERYESQTQFLRRNIITTSLNFQLGPASMLFKPFLLKNNKNVFENEMDIF